jgi:transcriptional regulator with XRE-family HTH domain
MELYEKIRLLRQSKGISQIHIARKMGLTASGYNMKELGKRPINTKELEVIAKELNVSPSIFFDDKFHVKLNKDKEVS